MSEQDRLSKIVAEYRQALAKLTDLAVEKQRELLEAHPDMADELKQLFSDDQEVEATVALGQPLSDTASFTPQDPDATLAHSPRSQPSPDAPTFGDYELLSEIAKGGMGVVYKARQTGLDRIVALKMIRSGELADDGDVERFQAEARAAAKLEHSGILPVHEIGERDGQHFFTMAYIEGGSLQNLLVDGPLPPNKAAEIVQQTAEAIQHAHEQGIVHRDLKPANILIDKDGLPKVADFGLAKRLEEDSGLTASGTAMGTPSYMPPEQALGKSDEIGPLADVYSLGAVLYCLLTGRPPFAADNYVETIKQVLEKEPVPPRTLNPSISKDLETICLKCLRKEQRSRYQSAAELAEDLRRWRKNKPIKARRVSRVEKSWLWCKRRPVVAGLLAAIVLIVGVGSGVFVERQHAIYAQGLIDSLVNADVQQVPPLIDQIRQYKWWTKPLLAARVETAVDGSLEKLKLRLALVQYDAEQVAALKESLLNLPDKQTDFLPVIRKTLEPHRAQIVDDLWRKLKDDSVENNVRFRAGLTLAKYQTDSPQWEETDYQFLVQQLVTSNPFHQPTLLRLLKPIGSSDSLLLPLETVFVDSNRPESQQLAAANTLTEFLGNDLARLAKLASAASPAQYAILYPLLEGSPALAASKTLREIAGTQPGDNMLQVDRVELGKRRAGAAITLLRNGQREEIFNVFRVTDDPESLTQFVHRCKDRGVTVQQLLECLERANEIRQSKTGRERKAEDRVLFGLLLALGEFTANEMPTPQREELVSQLVDWYASDPSSTIHGASGWLLRHWGYQAEAEKVDQTEVLPSQDREWFIQRVDVEIPGLRITKKKSFYFTFIVFQDGEYKIGAPDDQEGRDSDESSATVRLTRRFAVLDREITRGEFEAFGGRKLNIDRWSPRPGKHPVVAVSWYDSVVFCRSLTTKSGLSDDDQCYADAQAHSSRREPNPRFGQYPLNWEVRVDRGGFRLPTEAEWEVMCRSTTSSMYYFGSDRKLLDRYGWFTDNSDKKTRLPRSLRPNLRGLFDTHGNVIEWCHNWHSSHREMNLESLSGPPVGTSRVLRGGGFNDISSSCASAARGGLEPARQLANNGFRVVRSVSFPSSQH